MPVFVIGINHHSAPLELREKLAFPQERQADALADLAAQPGVAEAGLVSTCNRTEGDFRAGEPAPGSAWLNAQGPQQVVVANRTLARGEEFAARFGARAISLEDLPARLAEFDVVITGTASTLPILGKGMLERALKARRRRPIFIVDFAVPRDVDAEAATLEDIFLYTIDDLGKIAQDGAESRRAAVVEAEAIVERQVVAYREWQGSRAAVPAIVELRRRADQ